MKHKLQKMLALLMAAALFCAVFPLGAQATDTTPADLFTLVGTSRAEVHAKASDGSDVVALAFRFRIAANGLAIGAGRTTVTDNATVSFGGSNYRLVRFGAIMANKAAVGNNPNAFVLGTSGVTHIPANYLFSVGRNYGEFVARIVNVPLSRQDTLIYARPYFVYRDADGKEVTAYGNIDSANASGKKVRYSVETGSLDWQTGSLDMATGEEVVSANEVRSAFINDTDLLVRLPENAAGTPTAYVRAYYYSTEALLSVVDVKENWAVLSDLGVPADAVAVRLVAYDNPDEDTAFDPATAGDTILVTANKKLGAIPLTFHQGSLSEETGAVLENVDGTYTGYLSVQDAIIKPDSGCKFVPYYYDADGEFLYCGDFFMAKAKSLLFIAPLEATHVRFLLMRESEVEEDDEGEIEPEALAEDALVPDCVAHFRAYVKGSGQYEAFSDEANEEETKPTTTTTTESTTTSTTVSTTGGSSTTASTTTSTTTSTTKKPTTTKKTTTTTKVENLVLTEDKPENQGVQNALWNMEQMVKITFTPKAAIPQNLSTWPANVQQMGLPYSSTRIDQAYVPQNVSFHTFMTALQNPNSYLYTVDMSDYGNINGKTYYGAVCSTACGYALNIDASYTSYQWSIIPGMELLPKQDLQYLKLGDTIVGQGHVLMITGISRDQNGNIVKFRISEAAGADVHSRSYTISAMEDAYPADKYEYCRYSKISKVTYTASDYVAVGNEPAVSPTYNTNIIPRKGDKANWRSNETVILDVLKKANYTKVEIYKKNGDGTWSKQETRNITTTVRLSGQAPGTYKARLSNGTKTSRWCYWMVTDVASKGEHYQGTRQVKVSFSATNAKPLYVQWMNGNTNATVRITLLTAEQIKAGYGIFTPARGDLKVRVAFKTEYGIVYSELPDIITVE